MRNVILEMYELDMRVDERVPRYFSLLSPPPSAYTGIRYSLQDREYQILNILQGFCVPFRIEYSGLLYSVLCSNVAFSWLDPPGACPNRRLYDVSAGTC